MRVNIQEEYYCNNNEEKEYLISKGINYTFVKKVQDGKMMVTIWKYKKTGELYRVLTEFYKNN